MKKMHATTISILLMVSIFGINPNLLGQTCDCTDYIYLNDDPDNVNGSVHKFRINADQTLTQIGNPWFPVGGGLPSPHGLTQDINGNLYIGETASGDIRKLRCDGTILDESEYVIAEGGFNFVAIDGILYVPSATTNRITAYTICDGLPLGYIELSGVPATNGFSDGVDWGFDIDDDGVFYATYGLRVADPTAGRFVWKFTPTIADFTSNTAYAPIIDQTSFPAGIDLSAQVDVFGVTADAAGNIYVVVQEIVNVPFTITTWILKYDAAGNLVNSISEEATFDNAGFEQARGIVYYEPFDLLYLGGGPAAACVAAVEASTLTPVADPLGNVPGQQPKGIRLATECCPTQNLSLTETVCYDGADINYFLNDFTGCDDGPVCEGMWAEIADANDVFTYNECDLSVTVTGTGCATYVLEKTTPPTGSQQCGTFRIEVEICTGSPSATLTTTDGTCDLSNMPSDDAQVNLTAIEGDRVSIIAGTDYDLAGGAAYAAAVDLSGATSYDFTGLMQGTQYTVRVYNGSDACFTDYPVTTTTVVCMPTSCELALTTITPVCTFANDESTFTLDLTVNTTNAPVGEDLIVSINGNQVATMAPDASGTTTFTGISLTEGVSYGNTVTVNFATTTDCSAAGVFDLIACTPNCVSGVGGMVWNDFDNDGAGPMSTDAAETGQENVLVEVYDCNGVLVCETWTNANGEWTCPALTDNTQEYRVEFSTPLQDYLQPSYAGTDNGTNVQFVTGGAGCEVDYGVINPGDFCQEDPLVFVPCFVAGDPSSTTAPLDAFVSFDYGLTGNATPPTNTANKADIGSVFGVAYDRINEQFLLGAFLKRQVGLREGLAVNPLGAIYTIAPDGSNLGLWAEVANPGIVPDNSTRGLMGPSTPTYDIDPYDKIGKSGLGDVEINTDFSEVYTVNLNTRELVTIAVLADGSAGAQTTVPIPATLCDNADDSRPFALKFYEGKLYVGVTCSGQSTGSTDDISMGVLVYDPLTATFSPVPLFEEPLNYTRGVVYSFPAGCSAAWQPWTADYTDAFSCGLFSYYPSPMLSDIEFDEDGSVIVGLMDRYGHQQFSTNYPPNLAETTPIFTYGGGDILKLCPNGAGGYDYCPNNFNNGEGPNGGEFYDDGVFIFANMTGNHAETFTGGLALLPGSGEVVATVYDPRNAPDEGVDIFNEGGVKYFDNTDGSAMGYVVYGSILGTAAKGNGLGDLEFACAPLPIQIGNYAWIDANGDGIQQACEDPLADLPVALYDALGNLVAYTLTDANGNYYFDSQSSTDPNLVWVGTDADTTLVNDMDYVVVFGTDGTTPVYDAATGSLSLGGQSYELSPDNTGEGSNPDQNDADPLAAAAPGLPWDGLPSVSITADQTNHTIDAGFVPVCNLAITAITPDCIYDPGTDENTFSVTVELSYDFATLVASPDLINVTLDGTTLSTPSLNTAAGTTMVTFTGLTTPAYGLLIEAAFANSADCSATGIVDLIACTPDCVDGNGTIGGNVFQDTDNDGADAGAMEAGQGNVLVQVYDCDGNLACEVYTNADGNWSCDGLTDGEEYRVEFSTPLQPNLQPSFAGTDNGTNVQFVTSGTCEVDYGVVNLLDYCESDPNVLITCYINGDNAGTEDVIVGFPYSSTGENPPGKYTVTEASQAAATWGMAYNKITGKAYAAAVLKRHVGLTAAGIDAIFEVDPFSGSTNGSVWLELTEDLGVDVGQSLVGDNAARGLGSPTDQNHDTDAFDLVGTVGIGDIDISDDFTKLYVTNLFDNTILEIDIASKTLLNTYAVPDPGCANGDFRIWGLGVNEGEVYVGGVCNAISSQSTDDLQATVYRLTGNTFTNVLTFDLDYDRDDVYSVCSGIGNWQAWTNSIPNSCTTGGSSFVIIHPQPILSDIEFDVNGDMILGFVDRTGLQWGANNYGPDINSTQLYVVFSGGDVLRACASSTLWQIENSATSCTNSTGNAIGNGEFYGGEVYINQGNLIHEESALGSLAFLPNTGEVLVGAYDPVNGPDLFDRGGVIKLSNTTGEKTAVGTQLYGDGGATFGKGVGLGDMVLACAPPPIQIGNYAWIDANGDGIQQACEDPLADLPVALYDALGNLVAYTLTDANGNYYFDSQSSDDPNLVWVGTDADTTLVNDMDYVVVFGTDGTTPVYDAATGSLSLGGQSYELSPDNTGEGSNPDQNDADPLATAAPGLPWDGLPSVSITADQTNHTIDAGFIPAAGLTLGSTVFLDNDNNGLQDGPDAGIPDIEVQLWDAATMTQVLTDAQGELVSDPGLAAPVLTDMDGNYLFSNLPEGDYYVVLPMAPASARISSNATSSGFMETDPDDDVDNDDEGLQPGGSGTAVSSDTITLSAGLEPLNEPAQGGGQDTVSANGFTDENGNMTLDFGFFAPVSLGDTAFVDLDGNGLQTMGEPGIGGVTVVLLDSNGDTVMVDADGNMITGVTTTAADGSYSFDNLPPGEYSVVFDISTADNAEFYAFTTPNAGDDALDSDNSIALSDSTAQSDPTPFLNSGEQDLTLDVGVICNLSVELAAPFTICATQPIDLTTDVVITPDTTATFGASWTTPDGTGDFLDAAGNVLTMPYEYGAAVSYRPSSADAQRGEVTLVLTTDDPDGPCEAVSSQVTITILKVDCGEFFWDGQ